MGGEAFEDDLRIGVGVEGGSLGLQLRAQWQVVVQLAVIDDGVAIVGRGHGLCAGFAGDDRQSAVRQTDGSVREDSFTIGAAVDLRRIHCGEKIVIEPLIVTEVPANTAHAEPSCSYDSSLNDRAWHSMMRSAAPTGGTVR